MHKKILSKLFDSYESYFVGGCVRDQILGIHPKDWDICTEANPEQILDIFPNGKMVNAQEAYPIVVVDGYEIATFRSESGQRNNLSWSVGTFDEDWNRRDFTINCLYQNPYGDIIDPTGFGIYDCQNRILRFVGNPDERIFEDDVRVMRAFRFAARFNLAIEKNTERALREFSERFKI